MADLEPTHRALLLHTQGLTTAQIKETLALTDSLETKEKLTLAEQNLAMANAGLLKETTKLTAAEVKENLQSTFGHEADVKDLITKMGLIPVIDEQGDEIYELSAAKLTELAASKKLNKELLTEFGLRSGLNMSSSVEKGVNLVDSLKDSWEALILTMKKTGKGLIPVLVKLAHNPLTWVAVAAAVIGGLVAAHRAAAKAARENYQETDNQLQELNRELETTNSELETLKSIDPDDLTITQKEDLERLKEQNKELLVRQRYLEKQRKLDANEVAKYTNDTYSHQYSQKVDRNTIDAYKEQLGQSKISSRQKASSYLEGANNTESVQYAASQQAMNSEADSLAKLIAEYEYYAEAKQNAIDAGDINALDNYEEKLVKIEGQLVKEREQLQSMKTDFENADGYDLQLEGTIQRIQAIDNVLHTAGKQVIDYINNTLTEDQKKELLGLQQTGQLTEGILRKNFSNVADFIDGSVASFDDFVAALELYQDEIQKTFSNTTVIKSAEQEVIASISKMSTGFDSLDKVMESMKDDKPFDYTLLDTEDFQTTFAGLGEEYRDFISIVSKSPKDVKKCQTAFDKLLDKWIESSDAIDGVTDETAQLAIDMLTVRGVTNAQVIVEDKLAQKHAEAASATIDLSNATYDEIASLAAESEQTDTAKRSFELYIAQKLLSNAAIDPTGDITALTSIINSLGIATNAWTDYYRAKSELDTMSNATTRTYTFRGNSATWKEYIDANGVSHAIKAENFGKELDKKVKETTEFLSKYQKDIEKIQQENTITEYTGPKSTDPSGSGGDSSKKEEDIDWYEHTIDLLERKRERLSQLGQSSSLAYLGLSKEDFEQAQAIVDSMNDSMTISMDNFVLLGQLASKAGMDISTFLNEIKNGGTEGRSGYLSALVETDKQALELSRSIASAYLEDYKKAAEQIPEEIRKKIESGGAGIETFTGEESEAVKNAYDLYKKYLDQIDDANDKKQRLYETNRLLYENELEYLDSQAAQIEHRNNMIQKQIDYLNTSGQILNASTYEHLIANLKSQQAILDRQIAAKKAEMARMLELGDENGGYNEGSAGYYEDLEYLNSAKESLADLILQQEEYNDTLRQLPVENLQKLVDMYNDITSAIESWGNAYESAGKTLNADYYQVLINNGHQTIAQLREQADAVRDVMDEYEVGSDKYMEMYNKLQDINSSIAGIVTNQNKWNQSILQLPLDKMSSVIDNLKLMKDALQSVVDEQQNVVSTITEMLDRQREMYEEQQKAEEDVIQKQLDSLNEQLELLEKQNEERDLQLQKEQALYDLHNAQTQKKIQVIRDGELVYEADQDAIRDAQEAVQDADYNIKKHDLELQVEKLEDDLESIGKKYDELYEKLDKIADKWNKIPSDTEYNSNKQLVEQWLGKGWEDKILNSTDEELYEYFKQQFEQNSESLDKYEDQIETAENIKNLVNTYLTAYRNGTITQEQAMTGIKNVLNGITSELTAGENIKNILNYLASANNTGATTNQILNATQAQLNNAATEMIESMKVYEENSNSIAENMQSFGELTENISDIRSLIDDVGDNLDDNLSDIRDILEDGFDDLIDALDGYRNRVEDDDEDDEDYGDISNGVIDAGDGNGNHDNSADYGPAFGTNDPSWDRERSKHRYAQGIEKGPIATSTMSEKQKALHAMATADLKPDEQPIIAHTGEVVLNKEQQDTIVKNGQRYTKVGLEGLLQSYGIPSTAGLTNFYQSLDIPKPDWNRPSITMQNSTPSKNISVTMGDIHLHEVQNPDGFAKALQNEFPGIAIQAMSKR